MARPVYPHELDDSDYNWLISNYLEQNPTSKVLDLVGLPVIILNFNLEQSDINLNRYNNVQLASNETEKEN
jgi:hypothetical protein